MKITKLKKTKSGKYDLILENNTKITTYDEVILAGAKSGSANQSYYLYKNASGGNNNYWWWTMSPFGYNRYGYEAYVWQVSETGDTGGNYVYNLNVNVRPVINLKADVKATLNSTTGHYVVQ